MAIVLVEGFDTYNGTGGATATTVGMAVRWAISSGGNVATSTTTPYSTGQSVIFSPSSGNPRAIYTSVPSASAGTIGFACYMDTYPNFGMSLATVGTGNTSGNRQVSLGMNAAGQLYVGTGTGTDPTAIFTTTKSLSLASWNYIEFEFTISPTAGTANIYVNGELVGSATGLNTRSQAGSTYNVLGFGTENAGATLTVGMTGLRVDDVYLTDTASRLGEQRVVTVLPTSDSTPSQWSASGGAVAPYTMVDEALCNADVDYIFDGTIGDRAVFNMASTGLTPVTVSAVQLGTFSRKTDSGARSIQLQYVSGGGTAYNSSDFALAASYQRQLSLLQTNPATSTAWTPSEANALKAGVRISV